jgi:two-component system response regulator HydG
MANRSILLVDDEERVRVSLSRALTDARTSVTVVASGEEALHSISETTPDLVITDIRMPRMSGLELLQLLVERAPDVDVILMTAHDDLQTAASAMRDGAADFLVKPLDLHQLRAVVDGVFRDRATRRSAASAGGDAEPDSDSGVALIGHHPSMVEIFKQIGKLATTRTTVLIRGESGTGKELIARAIHENADAAEAPFVAVNCTALPASLLESELFGHVKGAFTGAVASRKGRFALAGPGTIFLDEIGDTSAELQAKLLRVLEEGTYYPVGADQPERTEARVLAATHRDLESMVVSGDFRQDLYYRLRVVEMLVPPLRERREDIPALAEHLIAEASRAAGRTVPILSADARDLLMSHDWPGNVRELRNCLTRAVVLASSAVLRVEHLEVGSSNHEGARDLRTLEDVEAEHVSRVLRYTGGNRTRAAEILSVSRPRLRRMIDKYGLE